MMYILSFIVAFGVGAIAGQILIPLLRRLKAGQAIREDGPTWHMAKQGTPTMGGLMFILAIAVAVLTAGWHDLLAGNRNHLYVFLFALVFGIIGFIDDFQKLRHHANEGLTAPQKFLLQLAAAIAWALDQGRPGDVIVLAGKGHETYQEGGGVQYPMDEREIVADWFRERDGRKDRAGNLPAAVV